MDRDIRLVAKQSRDHELRAVTDGVDRAVFDNDALVADKEALEWADDAPKIRFLRA